MLIWVEKINWIRTAAEGEPFSKFDMEINELWNTSGYFFLRLSELMLNIQKRVGIYDTESEHAFPRTQY